MKILNPSLYHYRGGRGELRGRILPIVGCFIRAQRNGQNCLMILLHWPKPTLRTLARRLLQQWLPMDRKFQWLKGNRTRVSCILGRHHTTRPSKKLFVVPLQLMAMVPDWYIDNDSFLLTPCVTNPTPEPILCSQWLTKDTLGAIEEIVFGMELV